MGKAILHIHTRHSDGTATVEEILDHVEAHSDVDIVGFADHDNVQAHADALAWKARHPGSRVQPLWGCEVTLRGFKHVVALVPEPPFPAVPWPKFMPLGLAARTIRAAGGQIVVPHVDAFWIGLGRQTLRAIGPQLGIVGFELLTPIPGARRQAESLARYLGDSGLVPLGGSDAHHLEHLYQVIVEFPGHSVAEFAAALCAGTVQPRWGAPLAPVPLGRQLRQHTRALVGQPACQVRAWCGRRATQWVRSGEVTR